MKCPPDLLSELLSRPGVKSLGMGHGDHVANAGKVIGQAQSPVGHRPVSRKVRPNGENKTELDYYRKYLEPRLLAGEFLRVDFECFKFRLTPSFGKGHKAIWYTPDYIATLPDRTYEVHEIKGGWMEEDSHQKIKMFATEYPHIPLFLCRRGKGRWTVERIGKGTVIELEGVA